MFTELTHVTDPKVLEQKVSEYNALVTELWDKLMGYEVQLVDQLEVGMCKTKCTPLLDLPYNMCLCNDEC